MAQTAKQIVDSITTVLTKFNMTKDTRFDDDWIYYKVLQIAAELKIKQYVVTKTLDYTWLSSPITLSLYKVNRADDNSITCNCDISKTTIPQTISFPSQDGNLDLGIFSLNSMCGTKTYSLKRMTQWRYIPHESTFSLFPYYDRRNTDLYVNTIVDKLSFTGFLLDPTEGYLINSAPIASGSLVSGTAYLVKYGTVIYNNVVYNANATFTANATATFLGNGVIYLNTQAISYRDIDPFPASGEMIRQIELEILTKEFGIEAGEITDTRNDSIDDANKYTNK